MGCSPGYRGFDPLPSKKQILQDTESRHGAPFEGILSETRVDHQAFGSSPLLYGGGT